MSLELFGHPFSSYTWKALIALYAYNIAFDFRMVDGDHPDNAALVGAAGPAGKFPVLKDGSELLFEASVIIEHLALSHGSARELVPEDPHLANTVRMLDRVFDNYVMTPMNAVVVEHMRNRGAPETARIEDAKARLGRTYAWLEQWLRANPREPRITLVECAAAPSLFYADWVHPIPDALVHLREWRRDLLARPPVARCVEEARPYRAWFPPGAPDRD